MTVIDQAAGLRQWAGARHAPSPRQGEDGAPAHAGRTLVVVGLPGTSAHHTQRVLQLLDHWATQGRRWVGSPAMWRVAPVTVTSPHLTLLLKQQPRWALWVGNDPEAFRRAFAILTRLRDLGAPRRLLAVHSPDMPRRGLLDNLQQAALSCLGIELLVMAR
ncbi:MAG: hypothetical protein ACQEUN_03130 [Pseudomonadota bacterium]